MEMSDWKTDARLASYQQAPANHNKVKEKRETDQGLVLIYHDFAKYKVNLAATKGIEEDSDLELVEHEGKEIGEVDMTQMSWPWEPEFSEPESCVDWGETEVIMRSEVATFSVS